MTETIRGRGTERQTPRRPAPRADRKASGARRPVLRWTATVVAALGFLAAGGSMLLGAPEAVSTFDAYGAGQWLRFVVGTVAVLGAVAVLVPRTSRAASWAMAGLTTVAIGAHAAIGDLVGAVTFLLPLALVLALALAGGTRPSAG